jgi:hypothetical protein
MGLQPQLFFQIALFSFPVVFMHLYDAFKPQLAALRSRLPEPGRAWSEAAAYGTMLWLIMVNSGTPGEFIYFQF